MIREEAIKIFNTVLCLGKCDCPKDEIEECLKMAVEALETQPSEGEKVIRISKGTLKARTGKYVIYDVEWLKEHYNTTEAKIYGQPKTGHWFLSGGYWRCSECKEKALLKLDKATGGYREYEPIRSNYCPQCGAKMQEVKK